MIESCSRKRMLTWIGALLICTTLILFFEEYVEDSEYEAAKIFKGITDRKFESNNNNSVEEKSKDGRGGQSNPKKNVESKKRINDDSLPDVSPDEKVMLSKKMLKEGNCSEDETPKLVRSCVACSQLEMKILRIEHCTVTGYFDEFQCERTFQVPCLRRNFKTLVKFEMFSLASIACTVIFGAFVKWRKAAVEQRSFYSRLQTLDMAETVQ